jgi:alkane 1-monooxygenase
MGENIYKFALREIPGACRRAWLIERERLTRKGVPILGLQNEVLQSYLITAVMQVGLILAFGWIMLPFLLIHNFFSWWVLTSANYIEHYGLLRDTQADGKYERCQPHHSWNANHKYSNLLLFHLQRHSDHHANPTRRYQSLRHFENLPSLPSGYYGMYLIAYVPSLWFKILDPRLLALPHIDGDLSKVNVDPDAKQSIYAKYGQAIA